MINIAELLKDAPTGMKLYSPLFGEVEFAEVMDTDYVPIRVIKRGYGLRFDECGRYMGNEYPDSECLLFPSKDCRTWEGWKLHVEPKFKFKVGDWIVQNDNGTVSQITKTINGKDEYGEYRAYEHTNGYFAACFENEYHLWTIADAKDGDVLAADECYVIFKEIDGLNIKCYCTYHYMGFNPSFHIDTLQNKTAFKPATKEQSDLLFKKIKEAGYQWDSDNKELHKIQPHYDIANFHAGMPVLVRDYNNSQWSYVQFSHYVGECGFKFNACGIPYIQCIPFNDDTKHLLGTTDMCDEYYVNW